jgi:hypothetical protein
MKKVFYKVLYSGYFILTALIAMAQTPPTREWEFTGGNTGGDDWVIKIKQTSDGGYVGVGFSANEAGGGYYPSIFKLNHFGTPYWNTFDANSGITGGYAFDDVVETISGVDTQYVAVGTVKADEGLYDIDGNILENRTLFIARFDKNGVKLSDKILYNYLYFGGAVKYKCGETREARIVQAPDGNFVIAAKSDAWHKSQNLPTDPYKGQFDIVVFNINADFSTPSNNFKWICHQGEATNVDKRGWDVGDFIIDYIVSSATYSVMITGGKYNIITDNPTQLLNRTPNSQHPFAPHTLKIAKQKVFVTRIDINGINVAFPVGWPKDYDFSVANSYTALTNAPFRNEGSPGHTTSAAVNFYQNNHHDAGVGLYRNATNSNQYVVMAALNNFSGQNFLYSDATSHPDGFDDYKEGDVILFKTDLSGNMVANTAKQIMHASGADYKYGFSQDASGNIYSLATTADDSKPSPDNIDNVCTKWTGSNNSMHVTKYNNSFSRIWEFTQAGNKVPGQANYSMDCGFTLALDDEGGFVIAGNNDRRDDDYVVHKYYSDCEVNNVGYQFFNGLTLITATYNGGGGLYRIRGKLYVPAGVTATMNNYIFEFANSRQFIEFADMTKNVGASQPSEIYIAKGGKLILNNCTVRGISSCNGGMQWDGIYIEGDPTKTVSQLATEQGSLVLNNTTIQDALYGITVDGVYYAGKSTDAFWGNCENFGVGGAGHPFPQTSDGWANYRQTYLGTGQGGGIVQATSSTFLNCRKGVQFSDYAGPNNSFFTGCIFTNNAYMVEPKNRRNGLNTHLSMSNIKSAAGVTMVKGCTFRIDDAFFANYALNLRGFGIVDWKSNYIIDDNGAVHTAFRNLTTGVDHSGDGGTAAKLICRNAQVFNNQNGINIRATQNDVVNGTTFTIPPYNATFPDYAVGLSADGANLFIACNNTYAGSGANGTGTAGRVGAYIRNANSTYSAVVNSSFSGNVTGIQTVSDNTQLNFRRNTFNPGGTNANLISININANNQFVFAGDPGITKNQSGAGTDNLPENTIPACGFFANYHLTLGPHYQNATPYLYQTRVANEITNACSGYWDGTGITIGIPDARLTGVTTPDGSPSVLATCGESNAACINCREAEIVTNPEAVSMSERADKLLSYFAEAKAGGEQASLEARTYRAVEYLENFNDRDAQTLLVPAYYQLGMFDKMQAVLNKIADADDEATSFKMVYSLLGNAKAEGRTFAQLKLAEWNTLRILAQKGGTTASAISQNLLFQYQDEYYPVVVPPAPIEQSSLSQHQLLADGSGLFLYPNPASETIKISYLLTEGIETGEVELTDVTGKVISIIEIKSPFGELVYNANTLNAGIYFCALKQNGKITSTQKLIKL